MLRDRRRRKKTDQTRSRLHDRWELELSRGAGRIRHSQRVFLPVIGLNHALIE